MFADRVVRGAAVYKTLLIWPYAVAPAIAAVLWMFLFNPTLGIVAYWLTRAGIDWNYLLNGGQAMLLVVIAAVWKQVSYNFLFFLAGLQSIPKSLIEAAAIDGAGPVRRFATIVFPLLSPTTFFLLVVNIVYAFFDTFGIIDAATSGGPGPGHRDPRLQGVQGRLQGPRPRRLGGAVGDPDGDRDRAHRGAVPLRRAQGAVLMIENRPLLTFVSHLILVIGVAIVALPAVRHVRRLDAHRRGSAAGADAAAARRATSSRTTPRCLRTAPARPRRRSAG